MDHMKATSTGAAEKYALGEMGEQERDQYEEHFFACPECADEVKATAIFLDNAKPVLGEGASGAPRAGPSEPGSNERDTRFRWTDWRTLFWPLPLGAATSMLALLGVSGYQGLVLLPQMRHELREAVALQSAPSYFLSLSRGEVPVVRASAGQRVVALTLSRSSDRPLPFYRCEVLDAAGRSVMSRVVPGPSLGDELQILLPTERLQPGAYVLAVAGLESTSSRASAAGVVRYHFTFERNGARGKTM